jgi:hypothetical protein
MESSGTEDLFLRWLCRLSLVEHSNQKVYSSGSIGALTCSEAVVKIIGNREDVMMKSVSYYRSPGSFRFSQLAYTAIGFS